MTSDHTLDRPARAAAAHRPDIVPSLHLAMTVDDVLRLLPYGSIVLTAFQVDAGRGARTLAEAARAADLEPAVLLDALQSTVCPSFGAVEPDAAARRVG